MWVDLCSYRICPAEASWSNCIERGQSWQDGNQRHVRICELETQLSKANALEDVQEASCSHRPGITPGGQGNRTGQRHHKTSLRWELFPFLLLVQVFY